MLYVYVDLSCCSIGDIEFKALAFEIYKKVKRSKVMLTLAGFNPSYNIGTSIKHLIWKQSCIAGLMKICNGCIIIEGLVDDSACVMLTLSCSSIDSSLSYYIVLLLRSTDITILFLQGNNLHNAMLYLSSALKYSKIEVLDLTNCNIDDVSLDSLGRSLRESFIVQLTIEWNPSFYSCSL